VAAALAVVAQGETPLLLSPEDDRPQRLERDDRDGSPDGSPGGSRGADRRPDGPDGDRPARRGRAAGPRATYRVDVGRRHRVEPRQIVGALANEGGLSREDFGRIEIRADFSLVELPADLSPDVLDRLSGTRISGRLIDIRPDGRAGGGPAARRQRQVAP
jgi:ATP-dependent RNA helicase DeaD